MVKIFPAANSHEGGLDMAPGGHVTRSERSEARASRRAELKPCLDAGGNRLSTSSERLAAQRALRGGRRAPARRTRRRHRRALRRRTLARELCRVSHNAARYPKIRSRSFPVARDRSRKPRISLGEVAASRRRALRKRRSLMPLALATPSQVRGWSRGRLRGCRPRCNRTAL